MSNPKLWRLAYFITPTVNAVLVTELCDNKRLIVIFNLQKIKVKKNPLSRLLEFFKKNSTHGYITRMHCYLLYVSRNIPCQFITFKSVQHKAALESASLRSTLTKHAATLLETKNAAANCVLHLKKKSINFMTNDPNLFSRWFITDPYIKKAGENTALLDN